MKHAQPVVHAVLDVGGTTIKLGSVHGATARLASPVPTRAMDTAPTIIAQLQRAIDASMVLAGCAAGVAIAFPGPFDFAGGRPLLRGLGKFDAIHGVRLHDELWTSGLPLVFVRDSEAAAVGEARFGAGAAARRVFTIALGTGVGTCLTDRGLPVPAVDGQVVESLHQLATPDGRVDDVLSATGLADQLGVTTHDLGPLLVGGGFGDGQCATLRSYAHRLGAFLATQAYLEPDLIVVAGGLSGSLDLFVDAIGSHLDVPVAAARLGPAGPLLGAARLAFPEVDQ